MWLSQGPAVAQSFCAVWSVTKAYMYIHGIKTSILHRSENRSSLRFSSYRDIFLDIHLKYLLILYELKLVILHRTTVIHNDWCDTSSGNLFLRCLGILISIPLAMFSVLYLWVKISWIIHAVFLCTRLNLTRCCSMKTQQCFNLGVYSAQFQCWKVVIYSSYDENIPSLNTNMFKELCPFCCQIILLNFVLTSQLRTSIKRLR